MLRGICVLAFVMAAGTIGYMLIEGWSAYEAMYMTVITIATVGFTELHPLSETGRIFTMVLIFGGVGGAAYTLSAIMEYVLEGHVGGMLWRRQMENKITHLHNHFILCGYGRVGQEIANTFKAEKVKFVVIEREPELTNKAQENGHLYIQGNATDDEVLRRAGVEKAHGLVAALGSDIDNTYITLSAHRFQPNLLIVARASSTNAESKLKQAGANRVVLPQRSGGRRMAMLSLRPAVADFIETVAMSRGQELLLEDINVADNSPLVQLTTDQAEEYTHGARIVAIRQASGNLLVKPSAETPIQAGDQLVIMGTPKQLQALEALGQSSQR